MNERFDPRTLSADDYAEQIAQAERDVSDHRAALAKAEARLRWWRQGEALFGSGKRRSALDEVIWACEGEEIHPGEKPILRRAILQVMREQPGRTWRGPEMVTELRRRDWSPTGENADQIVRNRLASLAKSGDLVRVGYGAYELQGGDEMP